MKAVGRGRILIWEGASLWIMEALPVPGASTNATDFHAHHAIQIAMSLGGHCGLRTADNAITGNGAVAPDVSHQFEANGLIALLFIEPESQPGRAVMTSLFANAGLTRLPDSLLADLVARLAAACDSASPDEAVLAGIGHALVDRLAGIAHAEPLDPRIRRIIDFAASHLEGAVTLGAAARQAGLSASRARHLFVEQVGLPFRTYLLWLRITKAVGLYSGGSSLTEAAHEAGFSDSAHFSRTFRRMFGIPAASLRLI